ncbi:MAG: hypothetical protein K8G79_07360 [bacterium]|uniref:Uncharacterized protein n=1 Tax=Candidatus Methylomirabilis tolerans TaxID=3123416 RepID=A0AAJ1AK84_9BACT|nr:hypothetical protein [Candidatus Methylomirabilis sp.]
MEIDSVTSSAFACDCEHLQAYLSACDAQAGVAIRYAVALRGVGEAIPLRSLALLGMALQISVLCSARNDMSSSLIPDPAFVMDNPSDLW